MFVGRKEEGRAVLLSVRAGRGVVLAAPPGYGKTALLRELLPALEAWAPVVWAERVAPFGAFLKDLYRGLWDAGVPVEGVGRGRDFEADLKAWQRRCPGNEEKARSLVRALKRPEGVNPITLVVDDATGVTASMVPWLVALSEVATLVLAVHPETLRKAVPGGLEVQPGVADIGRRRVDLRSPRPDPPGSPA